MLSAILRNHYNADGRIWELYFCCFIAAPNHIATAQVEKFLDGKYGDITKRQFAKMLGTGVSTFHRYENCVRTINKQEKKELKVLADDFGLLHREDVQEIIETCKSYEEGQKRIMRVYTEVYMR